VRRAFSRTQQMESNSMRTKRKGKTTKAQKPEPYKYLRKQYPDLPVIDADKPLDLGNFTKSDQAKAVPRAPRRCLFACRGIKSPGVLEAEIWPTNAYLRYKDHIMRYELHRRERDTVVVIDGNGSYTTNHAKLIPVAPSHRLGVPRAGRTGGGKGGITERKGARPDRVKKDARDDGLRSWRNPL